MTYVYREGTLEDVPKFIPLAQQFYEEGRVEERTGVPFDLESCECSLEVIVESPDAFGFIVETDEGTPVGYLAGTIGPSLFNLDARVATELGWWIHPDHRNGSIGPRLLQVTKKKLKERGVKRMSMIHFDEDPQVGKFYEKLGMVRTETIWFWEF